MNRKQYTQNEEIVNAATHGIGILLGMAAGIWLLCKALFYGDLWAVSSVSIYVICMLFSYTASTLYHACREEKRKIPLRKLDHAAIYFHIAGTYTFFTLTILRNAALWGWSLFFVVWTAALAGSYISFKGKGIGNRIETICYVVMGLVVFVAFKPLFDTLNSVKALDVLWYIIAGGVSFILGAFLYSFKKIPYVHAIFHLFVIGGSLFHVLAIAIALERLFNF
jgi:hemolysin III